MKRRSNLYIILLVILLASSLHGCSSAPDDMTDEQIPADGIYQIYYTDLEGTSLVRRDYQAKSEDFEGLLAEILEAFQNPDGSDIRSALPEQVKINSTVIGINEIAVDFNAEYLSLDTITELLLRGALVKTLVTLKGVDAVRFTVDSQNLVIGDEEIGPMTNDTFIVPVGKGINSYRNALVTLYFPVEDGSMTAKESRTVHYSSNVNKEKMVIEEMLKGPQGPQSDQMLPVAVDGTLVQDVSVNNGYCIVDFSSEMNSAPPGEVIANPETVLYAFTNAIIDSCPEDKLTGVRFRIEGSSDTRFRDQVNLDQVFTRNADVIYNPVVKLEESEGE